MPSLNISPKRSISQSRVACLIRQTSDSWIVSMGDMPPVVLSVADTKPAVLAQSVADYLERAKPKYGACGDKIVLCPESRAALFATSSIPDSLKTKDRQQLKFHAESLLPLDAEEMAADFVLTSKDIRVMAIDRNEWQPIIDALASRNLHFRWIAPASILALEEARRTIGDSARAVIWEDEGALELWLLDAQGIVQWTHLTSGVDDRLAAMRLFAAQTPSVRTWLAINCSSDTLSQLSELKNIEIRSSELQSQAAFAASAANRLCTSTWEPWFDLRDGTIAGSDRYRALLGWIQVATAAVAGLLLAASAAFYWKSAQAESEIASINDAKRQLYRAEFPGEEVPPLPRLSRSIKNAHSRIQGETDSKGESEVVPPALELLHATLMALSPEEPIWVRANSLVIAKGELTLEATFNSEQDGAVVALRLEKAGFAMGQYSPTNEKGKTKATFKGKLVTPTKVGSARSNRAELNKVGYE